MTFDSAAGGCPFCGPSYAPTASLPVPQSTVALAQPEPAQSLAPGYPQAPAGQLAQGHGPAPAAYPTPTFQQAQPVMIAVPDRRDPVLAALLGFLFGPLGLLYASPLWALVMFGVNLLIAIFTLGIGLLLTWPVCAIVGYVAANNHNNRFLVPATVGYPVTMTGGAPAGWYRDPSGSATQRYWDGWRWTEHVA
jgi:hypothetical protein